MTDLISFVQDIKKPSPVAEGEEFCFAAAGLDHGHINSMVSELAAVGAKLLYVYDSDVRRAESMAKHYGAEVVDSMERIYEDKRVKLVASAAVPSERGPLGCEVMRHGIDYFVDKSPFTTLEQLEEAKKICAETGRRYFVFYCERLHNECSILAGDLIKAGMIGKVVNVIGTGPHRISLSSRPQWFYTRKKYGGILTDIGSHQAEQFLYYTDCDDVTVTSSAIGNFKFPDYPELDDFGEMHLRAKNGATGYHRIDWYTPEGLKSWGDGRCFIEGTDGFIELRKNIDITQTRAGNRLYLVNNDGEFFIDANGKTGFPFFGEMVLDCLEGTERAMTQEHIFKAAEVAMIAQKMAVELTERESRYL